MTDPIEEFIRESFASNLQIVQMEGGHALAPDVHQAALNQVLLYWRRLRDVAEKVTDTEVRLNLPNQQTPAGRKFGIDGVVDIVRENDRVIMYDVKTHDASVVRENPEGYEKQLNIYAYIWQTLRGQPLDETAIICTSFPEAIRRALQTDDGGTQLAAELQKWEPVIPIAFSQRRVEETIEDFKRVVDLIEDRRFAPPSQETLKTKTPGAPAIFAVHTCRNCDARFSCSAYYTYSKSSYGNDANFVRRYFGDVASDEDRDDWTRAALDVAPTLNPDDFTP